jgi:hypothetical protein
VRPHLLDVKPPDRLSSAVVAGAAARALEHGWTGPARRGPQPATGGGAGVFGVGLGHAGGAVPGPGAERRGPDGPVADGAPAACVLLIENNGVD